MPLEEWYKHGSLHHRTTTTDARGYKITATRRKILIKAAVADAQLQQKRRIAEENKKRSAIVVEQRKTATKPVKLSQVVVKCPFCNSFVPGGQVREHMAGLHPPAGVITSIAEAITAGLREAQIEAALVEARAATATVKQYKSEAKPTKKLPLVLTSRRGTRVDDGTPCTSCGRKDMTVWRYRESNYGVVHLCCNCKSKVFERSFGKVDALDRAVSGGGIETNRRRH